MKILVCISRVPDTASKINFVEEDRMFDSKGVKFVINPNDEFGLTRAIWFKEKNSATIDVVTVGGVEAEQVLNKALAIGADSAIRVDAKPSDGFFVAKQLAKVAKEGEYNLIIAGRESVDYNGGAVPGMIAAMNRYSFVNNCIGLEINDNRAIAIREMDEGRETIEASLPLVIGGQKGLVEEKDLKIPNMRGIIMARKKPLKVIEPLEESGRVKSVKFFKPAVKSGVQLISPDNIKELVELLHKKAKVI